MQFYRTPAVLSGLFSGVLWRVNTTKKEIYLTFDDGPIPQLTAYILRELQQHHVEATFFCVGDNIRKYPVICQDIVDAGHTIANHTFHHLKGWKTKNAHYSMNIEKCQALINQYQSMENKPFFRPPYGQITPIQASMLRQHYRIVMWDILAYDFSNAHTPQQSLWHILQKTRAGSVVVFHDNYKAEAKLKYMWPRYLDEMKNRGFVFKKLGKTDWGE